MNKPSLVLGVVASLAVSYMAGQKSFGISHEYEHADVIDMVENCGEGTNQFIGGCKLCGDCEPDEYKAGGCSYFKNTLCTLCTDIRHCQHENIRCTNRADEVCILCDYGYWDQDCKPCTVCNDVPGMYEIKACEQEADAECSTCTVCGDYEYTTKLCDATSDSECTPCSDCDLDTWMSAKCQTKEDMRLTSVEYSVLTGERGSVDVGTQTWLGSGPYEMGVDTQCAGCQACTPRNSQFQGSPMFSTDRCKTTPFNSPTACTDCSLCPEGSFIEKLCEVGGTQEMGTDTLCQDCTQPNEGEWTVFPCSPSHTSDAIYQTCSDCSAGEYKFADCTETSDTVCPRCPDASTMLYQGDPGFRTGLQYCSRNDVTEMFELRCSAEEDEDGVVTPTSSKCGSWECNRDYEDNCPSRCTHGFMGTANCGEWESFCEDGFSGESCCFHKYPMSCGSITARERIGIREGYTGETTDDFVHFCEVLCDEFPDCMAFEVKDGGTAEDPSGPNILNGDSVCYFKAAYSQDPYGNWYGDDPSFDCYSNTCRQNEYQIEDSRFSKTINYDVDAEVKSIFGLTAGLVATDGNDAEGDGSQDLMNVGVQGGNGAGARSHKATANSGGGTETSTADNARHFSKSHKATANTGDGTESSTADNARHFSKSHEATAERKMRTRK